MLEMAFPCRLDAGLGRFIRLDERDEVAQSVRLILTTRPGERPLRPDFGANLDRFAFEVMNTTTRNLISREVVRSLLEWEPRIADVEVEFQEGERGELMANVTYELALNGQKGEVSVPLPRYDAP